MKAIFTISLILFLGAPIMFSQCWDQVSVGRGHSLAIHNDGTLWAWGANQYGELGDGTNVKKNIPVQIGADDDWKQISAGEDYNLAIKNDGSLWSWGRNEYGVLGDGTTMNRNSPKQIGIDTDWKQVSASIYQSGAIKNDGTAWLWGNNAYGQLGNVNLVPNAPSRLLSISNCSQISAGRLFYTFLKDDGSLWAQGVNSYGQLGDGTLLDRLTPIRVGVSNDWIYTSSGAFHTLAIQKDKTLWGWGKGENVGNGPGVDQSQPKKITAGKDWEKVSAGYNHSMAIKSNGSLWGWGDNYSGQLGIGSNTYKLIPTRVGTANDWVYVEAGELGVTIGLRGDGTSWMCGYNYAGQLGDGTNIDKNVPVKVLCVMPQISIWSKQNVTLPLESRGWEVEIVNENVVWFFGEGGNALPDSWVKSYLNYSFARTVNGGQQWMTGTFPFNGKVGDLTHMTAIDDTTAWVTYVESFDDQFGSYTSRVYKTTNGGNNWNLDNIDIGSNWVNVIHFFNKNDGFIMADATTTNFNIYTTSNGGDTWTKVTSALIPDLLDGDEYGLNFLASNGNKVWFPTYSGRIFYSSDKGNSWEVFDGPSDMLGLILQIAADDLGNLYIDDVDLQNQKHRFFRRNASDGTWTNLTPTNNNGSFFFSSIPGTQSLILIDSNDKNTRISNDKGQSWIIIDTVNTDNKYFINFLNSKTGFSSNRDSGAGTNSILKYIGSPISGLLSQKVLNIDMQLYPVPSSDIITLEFDIVKNEEFWILIHDVSGNLLYKKSVWDNGNGSIKEKLIISTYSAGTYFLTISNQIGAKSVTFTKI